MITRNDIIEQLLLDPEASKEEKYTNISTYLDGRGVSQSEKEKILSDLISYVEY